MSIIVHCPGCSKRYELSDTLAGKRARCKQCTMEFRIPDEEPVPARSVARPSPLDVDDDLPPPPRATVRPVKTRRKKLEGRLPPLLKVLLCILAGLLFFPFLLLAGVGLAKGQTGPLLLTLVMLPLFACIGLLVVCKLKLVFMMAEVSALEAVLTFFFDFPYIFVILARFWDDTKRVGAAYFAAMIGIFVWAVAAPPLLNQMKGPRPVAQAAVPFGPRPGMVRRPGPARENQVQLVVMNVPSMKAYAALQEKVKALFDPGDHVSLSTSYSPGQPAIFTLWPIPDPQSFADRITFGRVLTTSTDRVVVAANPAAFREVEVAAAPGLQAESAPPPSPDTAPARPRFRPREQARTNEPRNPAPPASADPLTRALSDLKAADKGQQKRAVQSLARLAPVDDRRKEVQDALRPLLEDEDGFFVNDVIKAMAAWHTDDTVPALIPMTTDSRFGVRWQAIETLGKLKDPRAAEPIASRLEEDGIKAEPALRTLGPAAEPTLIGLLKNPDPHVRSKACRILADIGGKETLKFMSKARPDADFGVRVAAQQAMQAIAARVGSAR